MSFLWRARKPTGDDKPVDVGQFPAADSAQRVNSNSSSSSNSGTSSSSSSSSSLSSRLSRQSVMAPPDQARPLPKFNFDHLAVPAGPAGPAGPRPSVQGRAPPAQASQSQSSRHRPAGARAKIILEPGFSQLDWAALANSGRDLSGQHDYADHDSHDSIISKSSRTVTADELRQHTNQDDAWTCLGGRVYNITPYMRFHPGGVPELMRCAGRDGTALFNATHAWVNYDRMLRTCLVGRMV
ncbi:cytochrome b5-like heme/steroid binding domain-containing protein [Lipomyces japonicus]|uniref:cytochrome b5-like heme/steroid binding domain-containing protein n=1 Tax=Lipomyces japonicus TaxID=56871 RepID=UPI0034CD2813